MRVAVCPVEELPPGELRAVDVDRRSICVINSGGRFYAVRNRCPHQGSQLAKGTVAGTMVPSAPHQLVYGMEGRVLRCGWHAWEFDLETGNPRIRGPGRFDRLVLLFLGRVRVGLSRGNPSSRPQSGEGLS